MTNPTPQDREMAETLAGDTREWALESADLVDAWNAFRRNVTCIKAYEKPMAIAFEAGFTTARLQGRREALEEAARVADRHDTGDCTREDMEARRIAANIRKLGE